jgi:hypothetical protein
MAIMGRTAQGPILRLGFENQQVFPKLQRRATVKAAAGHSPTPHRLPASASRHRLALEVAAPNHGLGMGLHRRAVFHLASANGSFRERTFRQLATQS